MDQIEIPGVDTPPSRKPRKPGRPRKWESEAERRAAENEKRRARRALEREGAAVLETADPEARRRLAIEARLAALAPPVLELEVTDDDLVEFAQVRPNVAEGFQYARDVIAGKIVACDWVRRACQRHERDLARIEANDWPFTFDAHCAERAIRAIQNFREVRGPRAGKRFRFGPWQKFIIASLFGWLSKSNGFRRYRYGFVAVPRGNGKSSLAATLALFMLALDREGGAEVYAAAVTRDQARIVFNLAQHMAQVDSGFRSKYGVNVGSKAIVQESTASIFKPLSRDAQSLDGLNVHFVVLDELAAHKTRETHDVLITAMGKRSQPLALSITTAGTNQSGIGFEQWRYAMKVLRRDTVDEAFFAIIYTIDDADDWQDPASWAKANPNFGASVNPDAIANLANKARQIASQQTAFKQKHLNVWTNAAVSWLNMLQWDQCADANLSDAEFAGEPCVIGLDLAAKIDLAARVKVFSRVLDGVTHYYAFAHFYLPDAAILDGRNASYQTWEAENWITATPGEVIDFDRIENDILDDARRHAVTDVAYDPWQALKLATELAAKDIPVIEYRPTVANFSPAMKEIDALVRQGRFHHDGNAVLRWNVACVEVLEDFKGNIYPRKDKNNPQQKIDGLVALLMAMGRLLALEATPGGEPSLSFV